MHRHRKRRSPPMTAQSPRSEVPATDRPSPDAAHLPFPTTATVMLAQHSRKVLRRTLSGGRIGQVQPSGRLRHATPSNGPPAGSATERAARAVVGCS